MLEMCRKDVEERSKENEDWVDSKEDLKERKKEADKAKWRFVPRVTEKIERPKGGPSKRCMSEKNTYNNSTQ